MLATEAAGRSDGGRESLSHARDDGQRLVRELTPRHADHAMPGRGERRIALAVTLERQPMPMESVAIHFDD